MHKPCDDCCCRLSEEIRQQLRAITAILIAIQTGKPVDLHLILGIEKGTENVPSASQEKP